MKMPPTQRTHEEPEGGWAENAVYLVDVAFRLNNPVHRAIFFTGFLRNGQPGNYSALFNPSWDGNAHPNDLHYLSPVCKLDVNFDEDVT